MENLSPREIKAIEIADKFRIVESGGKWIVPSQSGKGKYSVRLLNHSADCTCPDHEIRGGECKHILAVKFFIEQRDNGDGTTTVTETFIATKRATYHQDWKAYNTAQTTEKDHFQVLLYGLCQGIVEPVQAKGRPRLPLSDAIFAANFKVYSTFSGRRFMCDLRDAHERGMISRVPHYNTIFSYLENPELTPLLNDLIVRSSLPLKSVEEHFACDSSGFGVSRFFRWYDHKYGVEKDMRDWVKIHIMCGTKTNIITAVEIQGRNANDAKLLPPLLNTTRENFAIREVSADKGYLSYDNVRAVTKAGATPFIAFKSNSTVGGKAMTGRNWNKAWAEMYHYFMFRRDEFLDHYHRRSNVESTFSMLKRKFGDNLRSKTDVAMVNEALCKVLCHNLVVLIHEIHELGIEATFWAKSEVAQ